MIEALETGERALIPYRWEQIGSKRVTSSRMQRRSSAAATGWTTEPHARQSQLHHRQRTDMSIRLDRLVDDLDLLYRLDSAPVDASMSRHLPRVYDDAGIDWRRFVEPLFARRFNGLMRAGEPEVSAVYGACFPSAEVLDAWLAVACRGDVLITHHPIDARNGSPVNESWAEAFVPIAAQRLDEIADRRLSMYACHAPMDVSLIAGTSASIVEALGGTVTDHFWLYSDAFAGHIADIAPTSSQALAARLRDIFHIDTVEVEVEGARHDTVTRVAVIAGVGDHVDHMAKAEALGAQACITGELHVRIEGEYGRAKFADVHAFAAGTGMTLVGVSHAASEHLVFETQLARWLIQTHGITLAPIREPKWWR